LSEIKEKLLQMKGVDSSGKPWKRDEL
jgi:hypothetical protein